jgi:tRNA (cmo5U34)-methyltransferase
VREAAETYYAGLSREYGTKIRQLVPRYEEMVEVLLDLLYLMRPRSVLDLGSGPGTLEHLLLERLPGAHLTAVEASREMVEVARSKTAGGKPSPPSGGVRWIHADVMDYHPESPFQAVLSNLVLHNLVSERRRTLLRRIHRWLEPGGVFLWGDLVRFRDPAIQEHFVLERTAFARSGGCPEALLRENFRKEGEDDTPWSTPETITEGLAAGFEDTELVWAHDTFAIFHLRRSKDSTAVHLPEAPDGR